MIFNRPSFRSHHQVRLVKSAYRPAESGPVHPRLVSWNCTALEAESARHFSHQTGQEMDVFIQKHWENMGRLRINGSFDDKTSFDYQRVPLSRSHDETTYDSRIVWFQPVSKSQSQVVMKNAVWTWFVFRHPTEPLVRSTMPRNFVGDDSASCRWDSQQLSRPCAGPGLVTVATVMSPTITTV